MSEPEASTVLSLYSNTISDSDLIKEGRITPMITLNTIKEHIGKSSIELINEWIESPQKRGEDNAKKLNIEKTNT